MTTSTTDAANALANGQNAAISRPSMLRWVLKRTALGIAILVVFIGAIAWLTYASIDPELERANAGAIDQAQDVDPTKVKF